MCPWGSVASEAGAKTKGQSQEPSQDGSCEARRRSDWGCGWRKARSTRWCWRRIGLGLFVVCLLAAFFLQSGVTVWQNSSRKTIQTHVILKRLNSKMAARLLIWFEWFTVAKLSTCFEVWCHVLGYSNPYLGFFFDDSKLHGKSTRFFLFKWQGVCHGVPKWLPNQRNANHVTLEFDMFCVGLGSYYALGVCEYPSARKVFRHSWHQNLSSGQEPEAEVAEDPQVTEAYDVEWKTPPSWKSRTRVAPGKNVVAALALSCYSLNIQSFQCLILNFNSQAVILTLIIQDATNGWCSTDCHKIHMGGEKNAVNTTYRSIAQGFLFTEKYSGGPTPTRL